MYFWYMLDKKIILGCFFKFKKSGFLIKKNCKTKKKQKLDRNKKRKKYRKKMAFAFENIEMQSFKKII
jgi:hypothetical protein